MDTTDFQVEGKALVQQTSSGDLILEGWAAWFDGDDRQNENIAPGALARGAKSFIEGRAPLCWNHQKSKVIGRVLEMEERAEGVWMRARVDGEIANHPEYKLLYAQIRKGTIDGLSLGGFFKRKTINGKRRIVEVDPTELSVTATPVHPKPSFRVVEVKSLRDPDSVQSQLLALGKNVELLGEAMTSFLRIAAAVKASQS